MVAPSGCPGCVGDRFTFYNHQSVIVEVIRLPTVGIITANKRGRAWQ